MEVPFERIGAGQVGRLAYQVIGSNGPINNPSKIRYLPPFDAIAQSSGVPASGGEGVAGLYVWSSIAQFVTLGVSAANLGVSLQTLSEVREVKRKLDRLQTQMYRVQATIDDVLRKVIRIDVNVAEGNLRSSLRHIMTGAITDTSVDLEALSAVSRDLDKFTDSFDRFGFGMAGGLKLSGDVRDMLSACLNAYRGARLTAMQRHNQRVLGNPLKVVAEDQAFNVELESLRRAVTFIMVVDGCLEGLGQEIGQRVYDEFFFADQQTGDKYKSLIAEEFSSQLAGYSRICNPLAHAIADEIGQVVGEHDEIRDLDEAVGNYLSCWASGSDAHLVWQLGVELDAYSDGDIWHSMEGWDGSLDSAGSQPVTEQIELSSVEMWIASEEAARI